MSPRSTKHILPFLSPRTATVISYLWMQMDALQTSVSVQKHQHVMAEAIANFLSQPEVQHVLCSKTHIYHKVSWDTHTPVLKLL